MEALRRFAVNNIYAAPGQDQQFSFKLTRVNDSKRPVTSSINIYHRVKKLPVTNNAQSRYHVFMISGLNAMFLNLLRQKKDWFRDEWIRASDDMVARNYVLKVYSAKGVIYPRQHIFYSFIDENSVIIALEVTLSLSTVFDAGSFEYLHVYSNNYFKTNQFLTLPVVLGIKYGFRFVLNNIDKVALQNLISGYERNGGKAIVYVNGKHTDGLNLNIENNSFIEIVYDQSIISTERYSVNDLRTFISLRDNRLKYLLFRNRVIDSIQFKDDTEIYISNNNALVTTGLFFYQHKDHAVRNVTDKDYSLDAAFVNNSAQDVTNLTGGAIHDKSVVLYSRKAGIDRKLIYNSSKLHELYKLPLDVRLNTILDSGLGITEWRAEWLENSDYFKVLSMPGGAKNITLDLVTKALGYNSIGYYFANSPLSVGVQTLEVNVPTLYQEPSTVFEYNATGAFLGWKTTSGPIYLKNSPTASYVEFIYGQTPNDFGTLLSNTEVTNLRHSEFKVLSALFSGVNRLTNWVDITDDRTKCTVSNNMLILTENQNHKVKVVYLNEPNIYNVTINSNSGMLYFPIMVTEDRGTGMLSFPADVPYTNIEVFLNNNKLAYGIDYFVNFPNISICNKKYLNTHTTEQSIHIRAYGFTLDLSNINKEEKIGFVHNGVLSRNNHFDIRDDKVMSIFIDGKLYNRSNIRFAEEDNTVRLSSPLNGLPYVIKEPFIPLKSITDTDTVTLRNNSIVSNNRISALFNKIFPEPDFTDKNVISGRHHLFSPLVNKVVSDMLDGNIPASLYTSPFNDDTIFNLLSQYPYKELLLLDPIRNIKPNNITEIHPHVSLNPITLNLFQHRFITNLISVATNRNPSIVNTSGHFTVTA